MTVPRLTAIALAAIAAAAGVPASAQDDRAENCDRVLAYEDLAGSYTITLGPSLLTAPGAPSIPMPTEDVLQGTMAAIGESLALDAPNTDVTLRFAGSAEPDWRWGTDEGMAHISSGDLGLALGCEVSDLPRLVGEGTGRSAEGHPLALTYRLVVVEDGYLYGQFRWQAQGLTMTRPATFRANEEPRGVRP